MAPQSKADMLAQQRQTFHKEVNANLDAVLTGIRDRLTAGMRKVAQGEWTIEMCSIDSLAAGVEAVIELTKQVRNVNQGVDAAMQATELLAGGLDSHGDRLTRLEQALEAP